MTVWTVATQDWCASSSNDYWRTVFQSDNFSEAEDFYNKFWTLQLTNFSDNLLGVYSSKHTLALGVVEDSWHLEPVLQKDWVVPKPCECKECLYQNHLAFLAEQEDLTPEDSDSHLEDLLPCGW